MQAYLALPVAALLYTQCAKTLRRSRVGALAVFWCEPHGHCWLHTVTQNHLWNLLLFHSSRAGSQKKNSMLRKCNFDQCHLLESCPPLQLLLGVIAPIRHKRHPSWCSDLALSLRHMLKAHAHDLLSCKPPLQISEFKQSPVASWAGGRIMPRWHVMCTFSTKGPLRENVMTSAQQRGEDCEKERPAIILVVAT